MGRLFNSWIKKKELHKMSYFLEPHTIFFRTHINLLNFLMTL